jgi:hypothetical protein
LISWLEEGRFDTRRPSRKLPEDHRV